LAFGLPFLYLSSNFVSGLGGATAVFTGGLGGSLVFTAAVFLGVAVGVGFCVGLVGVGTIVAVGTTVGSGVGVNVGVGSAVSVGSAVGFNEGSTVGIGVGDCVDSIVGVASGLLGSIVLTGEVVFITLPPVLFAGLLFLLLKLANRKITATNKTNRNTPVILFLFFTS